MYDLIVKRQGNRWGIFDHNTGELIEGGFFDRKAAEKVCQDWLVEQVREAERKAGWDPNPLMGKPWYLEELDSADRAAYEQWLEELRCEDSLQSPPSPPALHVERKAAVFNLTMFWPSSRR